MPALQQNQVGTAVLAHRAAQWASSFQLLDQQTWRKGYRLTIAVAGLRPGLLEISAIFVPFRKSRSSKLKSLLHSIPRAFPLPHFLVFPSRQKVLSATFAHFKGRSRTLGCFPFSFYLLSPQRGCTAARNKHRHTGAFDPPLPFFLQDPPGWIHFLLWEIKWHSRGGGRGGVTAFISSRKWSVFRL